MQIRAFHKTDTPFVIQLWQACGLTTPWNDPQEDIDRKLQVMPELFLVGELDNGVIATVMGGYDGHRGWVNYLAVNPVQQHRQFGQQMMLAIESRLLALGCPKINLQIRATNIVIKRFYEQMGFTQDDCISLGKRLIPDQR